MAERRKRHFMVSYPIMLYKFREKYNKVMLQNAQASKNPSRKRSAEELTKVCKRRRSSLRQEDRSILEIKPVEHCHMDEVENNNSENIAVNSESPITAEQADEEPKNVTNTVYINNDATEDKNEENAMAYNASFEKRPSEEIPVQKMEVVEGNDNDNEEDVKCENINSINSDANRYENNEEHAVDNDASNALVEKEEARDEINERNTCDNNEIIIVNSDVTSDDDLTIIENECQDIKQHTSAEEMGIDTAASNFCQEAENTCENIAPEENSDGQKESTKIQQDESTCINEEENQEQNICAPEEPVDKNTQDVLFNENNAENNNYEVNEKPIEEVDHTALASVSAEGSDSLSSEFTILKTEDSILLDEDEILNTNKTVNETINSKMFNPACESENMEVSEIIKYKMDANENALEINNLKLNINELQLEINEQKSKINTLASENHYLAADKNCALKKNAELQSEMEEISKMNRFYEAQLLDSDGIIKVLKEENNMLKNAESRSTGKENQSNTIDKMDFMEELNKIKRIHFKEVALLRLQIEELEEEIKK
ncbi:hypothetical protein ENBRE01_2853 [Enteropsectra breve]|nr:hypothetical protein ENBRE01_2853 [Enteropsectra breve]